jgi:hypothetical protein
MKNQTWNDNDNQTDSTYRIVLPPPWGERLGAGHYGLVALRGDNGVKYYVYITKSYSRFHRCGYRILD